MIDQASFFLKYLPIRISLVSMGTAKLPAYLGSTLRGVIGQALYHDNDAFNYLFNHRTLSDNQQDVANPYLIIPPTIGEDCYQPGEELRFDMYLLGDAEQYIQPVIHALAGIGALGLGALRCPFSLIKVVHSIDQRVIWQENRLNVIAAQSRALSYRQLPDIKQFTLRTRTPLRIRRDGALLEKIDFPTLIRNITRRIETITAWYGGWVDKSEIERIQKQSEAVSIVADHLVMKPLARYSSSQSGKMDLSGLVGMMRFEGDLTSFVPWLYAAQILHIGRNTTFGMGRMDVEFF